MVARQKGNATAAGRAAAQAATDAGANPEEIALAAASGAALIVDLYQGTQEEMVSATLEMGLWAKASATLEMASSGMVLETPARESWEMASASTLGMASLEMLSAMSVNV